MISVSNLTKKFGPKTAVDNISFEVGKGEVLGFLGPNGAGKSTTMRMITGYFEPSSGEIEVGGVNMLTNPLRAKAALGYLPENAPLYSDMTVAGFLAFAAELRGISGKKKAEAIDRALETCFLEPVRNQSVDTLSKGYRHRSCFAQSIIHDPDILILDEPTDGLDPNQKHEVRELIRRMGETKTIVFSTHILEEVEAACTRAIIIDQGKVIADGTPDDLKSRAKDAGNISVTISGMTGSGIEAELKKLPGADGVTIGKSSDDSFSGTLGISASGKAEKLSAAVFQLCKDKDLQLTELRQLEGRLDDVFRNMTVSDT